MINIKTINSNTTKTYLGMDGFLDKITSQLYVEGNLKVGEFKKGGIGFIKRAKELGADSQAIMYQRAPLILERQRVSLLDIILSCYDSDKTIKETVGRIHLYNGITHREGENPVQFNQLVLHIDKPIKLMDGTIPECRLTHYQECDSGFCVKPSTQYTSVKLKGRFSCDDRNKQLEWLYSEFFSKKEFSTNNISGELAKFWNTNLIDNYKEAVQEIHHLG